MKNPAIIPTNFRVPKGCRHEFILFNGNIPSASIYGRPGRKQIEFFQFGLKPLDDGLVMDWMQESVEQFREICS